MDRHSSVKSPHRLLADATKQASTGKASISLSSNLVATPTADNIKIAGLTFTAVTSLSGTPDDEFLIGATTADTIKNLADKNQPTALAVLRALNVIEAEQVAA